MQLETQEVEVAEDSNIAETCGELRQPRQS